MRQQLIKVSLYQVVTLILKLLFIIGIVIVVLLTLPTNLFAYQLNRSIQISMHSNSPLTLLPTVLPSPTASNSAPGSQDSQAQEIYSIAQNDVSIANTIIYGSEFFLVIVGLAFTTVSFFGIRELSLFRQLRTESESHLKQVTALEKQVKGKLDQVAQHSERERQISENRLEQLGVYIENQTQIFKDRIEQVTKQFEGESQQLAKQFEGESQQLAKLFESERQTFEEQLKQLAKLFEDESQKFMEAAYRFSQGTSAYRIGDNIHAIEHYSEALKLQPKNVRTLERLGRAYSNLDKMDKAIEYLEEALKIDSANVPALRSFALCYRYTDKEKAIKYLNASLKINPSGYEAWDFLGLLYRDQKLFDDAIAAHEKAFSIQQRPETEFYLGILYALKGDKIRAKLMAQTAYNDTLKQEHDQRIRPVWKILIYSAVPIIDGNKEEALGLIHTLTEYITTKRIYHAITAHLQFLLEGTDHKEWIPEFMDIVKLKEMEDVKA